MVTMKYYYDYAEKLVKVLAEAKQGKRALTIGFLGGSITQGCTPSKPENAYAMRIYHWFSRKFVNTPMRYINAGIGATGSLIGVHRVENDLLRHQPDIIIVEFAANDVPPSNKTHEAYESLIRRILKTCPDSAVIEVFMTLEDGTSAEAQQIQIAHQYHIPMVSFRQEVFNQIARKTYTWKDIVVDEVHPNDRGHEIVADLIINLLEYAYNQIPSKDIEVPLQLGKPLFSEKYIDGTILNNQTLQPLKIEGFAKSEEGFKSLNKGWALTKNDTHTTFICEINAKNIFLLYIRGIEKERAKVIIEINQQKVEIDSFFKEGWGSYAEACTLIEGENKQEYTIGISILDDNPDAQFNILGFLIS